jgi:hypothetical protein
MIAAPIAYSEKQKFEETETQDKETNEKPTR